MKALLLLLTVVSVLFADFSGTYEATVEGEKYQLTLSQSGEALTGTLSGEGMNLKLSGKVAGDSATGDFEVEGFKLPFRMSLAENKLNLKVGEYDDEGKADFSDADEYTLTRTSAPKAEEKKQKDRLFSKEPVKTLKNGKEYVHASGGRFRYPADWKLSEIEGGLQLTPPDATEGEAFVILAESAEGETDPASAMVLAYLDQQVASVFPTAKRIGKPEKAQVGAGKGAILIWDAGDTRIRGYATILKGFGVALVAAGPKERIEAREKTLREIFFTFGWGQGKVDQKLVGEWHHWSYSGTGSYSRENRARVVLNADGSFSYESSAETAMSAQGKNAGGEVEWTGGLASRNGSGWKGTWSADGSTMFLLFEDGSSESFKYRFKQEGGNTFLVATPEEGGKDIEWSRNRIG